jgi:hypothetical protein
MEMRGSLELHLTLRRRGGVEHHVALPRFNLYLQPECPVTIQLPFVLTSCHQSFRKHTVEMEAFKNIKHLRIY